MTSTSIGALAMSAAFPSLNEPGVPTSDQLLALYPILRQGIVVTGAEKLSSGDADELTELLKASEPEVAELERSLMEEFGGGNFRLTSDDVHDDNEVKVRRLSSPIVDFPNFIFDLHGYRLSSRCCVTVCANDRRSKVWTRFRLFSKGGENPVEFSASAAREFFELLAPISDKLLETMRSHYEGVLSGFRGRRSLTTLYNILVKAVDFDDAAAGLFLSHLRFGWRFSEVVVDRDMRALWEYFANAFDLPQLRLFADDTSEDFRRKLGSLEPRIVDTAYDQRGFYLADVADDHASFWGFGRFAEADASRKGPNTAGRLKLGSPLANGVADGVSVRLINMIGEEI